MSLLEKHVQRVTEIRLIVLVSVLLRTHKTTYYISIGVNGDAVS
jgi:hypothetical protein